ncbi:hypothetical protein FZW90_14390 [Listeria monocytogenes]|uniref:hypothetical protein n=1 Tax=Listeria monocytogenes TaxID=1639 RepID=UPI0011F05E7B|nr:hypothetical protein [Listeria monocytogenes]TYU72479.1 hypothetical protein FZW90_14390 [Listeria monocytogenes]
MKKVKISIVSFLGTIILSLIVYVGYINYQTYQANKLMNDAIKKAGLPISEVITIHATTYNQQGFFESEWYGEDITTKKDYKHWRQVVKKRGKYLSGKPLGDTAALSNPKNCELNYGLLLEDGVARIGPVYAGTSARSSQLDEFAYHFPNQFPGE